MPAQEADRDNPASGLSPYTFHIVPLHVSMVGFAVGIIAMYLPWVGVGDTNQPLGLIGGPGASGFNWGTGYFIAWLIGALLLLLRTVCRDADLGVRLPVADWFVFTACGVLMLAFALTVVDYVAMDDFGIVNFRYGLWLAIIAAVLVTLGGLMMRSQARPV